MIPIDPVLLYAANHYQNPSCNDWHEFYSDFQIQSQIKKMITKFKNTGEIKSRVFVNNFIMFFNVFEHQAAIRILISKFPDSHYSELKTVLDFLSRCPDKVLLKLNGETVSLNTVENNTLLFEKLAQDV